MSPTRTRRAVAAATAVAAAHGLAADDAVVLQASNRITLRLLPCDILARVAPPGVDSTRTEVELARRLALTGAPVAAPDPRVTARVHEHDGLDVTLWTHHAAVTTSRVPAPDYALALTRLHDGLRGIDLDTPHFTDRVAEARALVADPHRTPALSGPDRRLLADTLRDTERGIAEHDAPEQLLQGEPHPGNLIATARGPLFVDLETVCRGPVEFDLAHAPEAVADHHPAFDPELLRRCRLLVLAMITTWRWDRHDRFPDGHRQGAAWLDQLRTATEGSGSR
ncbi:aminoglycoside phosphotransferase family protein [Nocardiopsis sp. NPDC007018]|uniref:aminoglycoside phosphotransferase family protein n=1 Tax=Nocardiopsis sp. NPDC007018 TaxID=3155721 RepID=UPI0034031A38